MSLPKLKVLVIGSGGREDALAWNIKHSSKFSVEVFVAPGNGGSETSWYATNVDIKATEISQLVAWALKNEIDLTVVGPEAPLCAGVVDKFQKAGLKIFGPDRRAAGLEGSKALAKELMDECGISTAPFKIFTDHEEALRYMVEHDAPIVIKADGLAAGKGVKVCQTLDEAKNFLKACMVDKEFGKAGEMVVIEDCLEGEEISVLAMVDINGEVRLLLPSQDHKPLGENDTGPNTGGMGAYAPVHWVTEEMLDEIKQTVFLPVINGLRKSNIKYQGCLYAGLIYTPEGFKVLEFNVRFGDPETQPILALLKSDLAEILLACVNGTLNKIAIEWYDKYAVCVVLISEGYPVSYETGFKISGIKAAELKYTNLLVFHAGTKIDEGLLKTSGGRVLGITITGKTLEEAIKKAYQAIELINFENKKFRRDIGTKGPTS
jgi:phosphoribosylamine--glycine ligase